jgi:hypothetical protein
VAPAELRDARSEDWARPCLTCCWWCGLSLDRAWSVMHDALLRQRYWHKARDDERGLPQGIQLSGLELVPPMPLVFRELFVERDVRVR